MKCKKIQRLLNRYIDNEPRPCTQGRGELTEDIQRHLSGCKDCTYRLSELTRIKELIGAIPAYQPNPFLWTRIASVIEEKLPIPIGIIRVWIPIATILIILSGSILLILPKAKEPEIFTIPITQENMERITLNLLVYTNGEVPYVRF